MPSNESPDPKRSKANRTKQDVSGSQVPEKMTASPLDLPTIKAKLTTQEIVDIVRKGRERG